VIDALASATVPTSSDLVLTGRGLAAATGVAVWPDGDVAEPGQVQVLPLASPSPGDQVRIAAATLQSAGLDDRPRRVSVRLAGSRYTPYIVTRFT